MSSTTLARAFLLAATLVVAAPHALHAEDSIRALVERLIDGAPATRAAAAAALGERGAQAAPAVPELLLRLEDTDPTARAAVITALGAIGRADQPSGLAILRALAGDRDPTEEGCLSAVEVYGLLGDQAVGALVDAAEHAVLGWTRADADPSHARRKKAAKRAIELLAQRGADGVAAILAQFGAHQGEAREQRIEAMAEVFARMGAPAVEPLGLALGASDPRARMAAVRGLGRLRPHTTAVVALLGRAARDADAEVRVEAVEALGHSGAAGVAPLLAGWGDRAVTGALGRAFDRIGPDATSALIACAVDPAGDTALRAAAVVLIADRGDLPASWAGFVRTLLADKVPTLRAAACEFFARTGVSEELALALVGLAADAELSVRRAATRALGHAGPLALTARPALLAGLLDADPTVRANAACALGRGSPAEPRPAELYLPLAQLLRDDPDAQVRAAAAGAFGDLGTADDRAHEQLCVALADPDAAVAAEAARALGRVGRVGRARGAAALVAALEDPRAAVRRHAAMALGHTAASASAVAPPLVAALGHSDPFTAMAAEVSLLAIAARDEGAAVVAPLLTRALEVPGTRTKAIRVLAVAGATTPAETTAALVRLLAHDDPATRREAALGLSRLPGVVLAVAAPAALAALDDPDRAVQRAAVDAVRRASPLSAELQVGVASRLAGLVGKGTKRGSDEAYEIGCFATALLGLLAEQDHLSSAALELVYAHAAGDGVSTSDSVARAMLVERGGAIVPLVVAGLFAEDSSARYAAEEMLAGLARAGPMTPDAVAPIAAVFPRLYGGSRLDAIALLLAAEPGPRWTLELVAMGFGTMGSEHAGARQRAIRLLGRAGPEATISLLAVDDRGIVEFARGQLAARGEALVPCVVSQLAARTRAAIAVHVAADPAARPEASDPGLIEATERLIAARPDGEDSVAVADYQRQAAQTEALLELLEPLAAGTLNVEPSVGRAVRRALVACVGDPSSVAARAVLLPAVRRTPIEPDELADLLDHRETAAGAIAWLTAQSVRRAPAVAERVATRIADPEPWRRAAAAAGLVHLGAALDAPLKAVLRDGLGLEDFAGPIGELLAGR